MATITSKNIVDELIANDGNYEGDPQIYAIVEYKNISQEIVWGITWPHERDKHKYMTHLPPYVNNPKILWCKNRELVSRLVAK